MTVYRTSIEARNSSAFARLLPITPRRPLLRQLSQQPSWPLSPRQLFS
jgi:hypothetical protein